MPSPFPGMNPYLEQDVLWQDFHIKLLGAIKERLVPRVRPHYVVILERYVYVREQPDNEPEPLQPGHAATEIREAPAPAPAPDPVEVQHTGQDGERVAFLEIRDRTTGEVVSLLEMLCPSQKDDDRQQHLTRRQHVLGSAANLVEIDLLRGGGPMPDANRPACDYSVLVSRADRRPRAAFWPIRLSERLPVIPIPLRSPDSDVRIDLQEILHEVYDASGYEDFVYAGSPDPELLPAEAAWAQPFVPPEV